MPSGPQFDPGLVFDAFESADGDIPFRVWHGNATLFGGVLELFVTADVADFIPAVLGEPADYFATIHSPFMSLLSYTLFTHADRRAASRQAYSGSAAPRMYLAVIGPV